MKLSMREDGTRVLDAQGYSDYRLQIAVRNFLDIMKSGERAELVFDDLESHEPIELVLHSKGCEILEDIASGGVFRLKVKR